LQRLNKIKSIMQLKRSYFRHLNFENDINEFIFNARLANIVIKLAVKTGRPQYFKVTKVLQIYDN